MKKILLSLFLLLVFATKGYSTDLFDTDMGLPDAVVWGDIATEIITAQNNRDFSGETIGNWYIITDGDPTDCAYDTTDIGGDDDKQALITVDDDVSPTSYAYCVITSSYVGEVANTLQRFSMDAYVPAANTVKSVRLLESGFTMTNQSDNALGDDTWTEIELWMSLDSDIEGNYRVGFTSDPADGDLIYFDNISIQKSVAWVAAGTNLLEFYDADGALMITYVDNDAGASFTMADATDLTSDLTVGNIYKFSFNAKVTGGSADVEVAESDNTEIATQTLTASYADYSIYFIATNATTNKIQMDNMGAGEVVYIRHMTLEDITDTPLVDSMLIISMDNLMLDHAIVDCGGSGTGILVPTGITGTELYNLTIVDCDTAIQIQEDTTIKNVLFEDNTTDIDEDGGSATTANNYASATGDPNFTNEAGNDFTLTAASTCCINTGADPFSDGDGDKYDYGDSKVWSDTSDDVVGNWSDGVEIGAYSMLIDAQPILILIQQ